MNALRLVSLFALNQYGRARRAKLERSSTRESTTGFVEIRPEAYGSSARLENAPGRVADACSGRQSVQKSTYFGHISCAFVASFTAASTSDAKQLFAERHCHIARAAEKIAALRASDSAKLAIRPSDSQRCSSYREPATPQRRWRRRRCTRAPSPACQTRAPRSSRASSRRR